jgi:hypothetical protein
MLRVFSFFRTPPGRHQSYPYYESSFNSTANHNIYTDGCNFIVDNNNCAE